MIGFRFSFMVIFFAVQIACAQQKDLHRINFLLEKSEEYELKDNLLSLKYAKEASLVAEQTNNSYLKAKTYLQIADCLEVLDNNKESLFYIDKGLREKSTRSDDVLKASFKELKALNYIVLGLEELELKEYFEIIDLLSKKKDMPSRQLLSRINARIASFYYDKREYDYAGKFINRSLKIYRNDSQRNQWTDLDVADMYFVKGFICLHGRNEDSAYIYFNKVPALLKRGNRSLYRSYSAFGDYYLVKKEYNKALDAFLTSLDEINKFPGEDTYQLIDVSKKISEVYDLMGDEEGKRKYLEQYYIQKEKFDNAKQENIQAAINNILNEKTEDLKVSRQYYYWVILVLACLIIALSIIYYFNNKKASEKVKRKLEEHEVKLLKKEQEISERNQYTYKLEQKLQVSLEEVVREAKNNSPTFFEKFQLLYPQFRASLLDVSDDLTTGELILLAYVYLNFSSKEIADFTFRSYRTVQTRKYNLRKKLGLTSSKDLYIELMKIVKSD